MNEIGAFKKRKRVLIVEDSDDLREILCEWFKSVGMDHFGTASVAEFKVALALNPVDLIVADYHLPDGTAEDVVRFAQNNIPKPKVIMITGDFAALSRNRSGSQFDRVFLKPFNFSLMTEVFNP